MSTFSGLPSTSQLTTTESPSLSSRCLQCNIELNTKESGRNIVVCIDGTSNQFGQKNTNVVKLFADVDLESKSRKQFAYYSSGIGTRPQSWNVFARLGRAVSDKLQMAIAWNVEEIVKDAYGWLARNYEEGDQIYLFGFSRGAYQVRVLAAMIYEVGLIKAATENQIGMAYTHYKGIRSGKPGKGQIARNFKKTFSWKDMRVHFVGVWDTVSSVGLIKEDVYLSASSSTAHACHFRHALALDERRVKFLPEYFHEMKYDRRSKYDVGSPDVVHNVNERNAPEIKEVWFAGSHSDVGGQTRQGIPNHAGNVSLLWMRREAGESGLVLHPTDIVWIPSDLDFGTSESMTWGWRVIEWMPIKHQAFFGGSGGSAYRWHRLRPRRIIPGQKVHASILHANAYNPRASPGNNFNIPIVRVDPDAKLDGRLWETELFEGTVARKLIANLCGRQELAPIYVDRLLFMLRFREGKEYVRNVPNWQGELISLVKNPGSTPLVRLVSVIAHVTLSCDPVADLESTDQPHSELSDDILDEAKKDFCTILDARNHLDASKVVTFLRPLTKHQILRERILTQDVLESLVKLFDTMIIQWGKRFVLAMDGLICLLECEDTRQTILQKLRDSCPDLLPIRPFRLVVDPALSRISWIMSVSITSRSLGCGYADPRICVAALHMVMTLARLSPRVPEARDACSIVMPWINAMAIRDKRLVGPLAVEVFLTLYDPNEQNRPSIWGSHARENLNSVLAGANQAGMQGHGTGPAREMVRRFVLFWLAVDRLHVHSPLVRANLSTALFRLVSNQSDPADAQDRSVSSGEEVLRRIFGLDAVELSPAQKKLIGELKNAVQRGQGRGCAAATLTILKLCETPVIRAHLLQIELLDIFVDQLRRKNTALLAAYALATCLKHPDMKESLRDNELLPRNIVHMLRFDYFDDAVGQVEGFQVFGDLMQHADLREKIQKDDITAVLSAKLAKDRPKETRTSLTCLDIFQSFDQGGLWTSELVRKGLDYLRKPSWKDQKAGVAIFFALSQTERGVPAIKPKIREIVEMLLPVGYTPILPATRGGTASPVSSTVEVQGHSAAVESTADSGAGLISASSGAMRRPPWMLGPACALRLLAQNEELRNHARETEQYGSLKYLYLSGMLVDERDTSVLHVNSPDRADVIDMLDKMIKAIDGELSEEGLLTMEDTVLPHISHWKRLLARSAFVIGLPAFLGVSFLAVAVRFASLGASVVLSAVTSVAVSAVRSATPAPRALPGVRLSERKEASRQNTQVLKDQGEVEVQGAVA